MTKEKDKFNFAKAYQELNEINEWFRKEEIDLDEGLKKFKKGLELIKQCKRRLKEVENQFHEIKKEFSIEESEEMPEEEMSEEEIEDISL